MNRRLRSLLPEADEGAFDRICAHLNPGWIEEALQATGTASVRKRRLPSAQVLGWCWEWLFTGTGQFMS